MKKISTIFILVIIIALFGATLVSAQSGIKNVKGEVTDIDLIKGTIEIKTTKGEEFLVYVPTNFYLSALEEGDFIHIKGRVQEDGTVIADWVKDGEKDDGEVGGENGNGSKANSAFCSGRKDKPHPLAAGIFAKYDFPADEVMLYFCDGYGFGQIMLALHTEEMTGVRVSETLGNRKEGLGWGQIWKKLNLVGKPGEASSPPGHLKRPAHAGPPEGKGPNK